MKSVVPVFLLASAAALAVAQAAPKPAAKPSAAVHHARAAASTLPAGIPRVPGLAKTAFSLRYQEIKLGTGADAEPNKIYHVLYTGYLAADGRKFDSSWDHLPGLKDKEGKPVVDENGKPKLGAPEPITFPQGFRRVIPGFDEGFNGMKVGGKRRLFIPWQLAYGAKGRPGPSAADPGIPAKADLIFDVELVDVTDMAQMPMGHPGMGAMPGHALPPNHPAVTPGASAPAAPAAKPAAPEAANPAQNKPAATAPQQ